jgi:nitrogen fixation/metabolism regulation signal transduction histidine kinase
VSETTSISDTINTMYNHQRSHQTAFLLFYLELDFLVVFSIVWAFISKIVLLNSAIKLLVFSLESPLLRFLYKILFCYL